MFSFLVSSLFIYFRRVHVDEGSMLLVGVPPCSDAQAVPGPHSCEAVAKMVSDSSNFPSNESPLSLRWTEGPISQLL